MMEIFDALPPSIRRAIIGADFPFDPALALRFLRRGASPDRIVAVVAAVDRHFAGIGGAA